MISRDRFMESRALSLAWWEWAALLVSALPMYFGVASVALRITPGNSTLSMIAILFGPIAILAAPLIAVSLEASGIGRVGVLVVSVIALIGMRFDLKDSAEDRLVWQVFVIVLVLQIVTTITALLAKGPKKM